MCEALIDRHMFHMAVTHQIPYRQNKHLITNGRGIEMCNALKEKGHD